MPQMAERGAAETSLPHLRGQSPGMPLVDMSARCHAGSMGLRLQRRKKLLPGVTLNVSKRRAELSCVWRRRRRRYGARPRTFQYAIATDSAPMPTTRA